MAAVETGAACVGGGKRMNFFLGLGIFMASVIYGIFLIALVSANRRDDDEN